MHKLKLIQAIHEHGVVAVMRGDNWQQVVEMSVEAITGGIKVIEVTMTVPHALKAIEALRERYSSTATEPEHYAIIGVGTVLDPETARMAILAGAEFVVGPSLNPATVQLCNRYRVPIMPGVMTIQDIQTALELGVDVVKLFPGNMYGPRTIKDIKGPLPYANIMPTGGVNVVNLGEWIKAGAFAVGIGSDLIADALETGDYTHVRRKAEQYMAEFAKYR
ncbi:bifunctional 2-keto-4-hydroxyglutarate aldolase/2-keto-3-deoxy-6-phosphogluconate aldolase [Paenibacillus sp. N1-5-1-14]|uniref:bifunctional 2-keto-4-hydroxyglutarate aldolase/2-keto-3-deoxy-6-phosphogluconate aldolase n=1 Tax=Paenibacillus radicibacter TaxID=2972488 RepID=UPI0021594BC8|nr:bifunctional 2-keto-4-hydroxyglutarate aldolase/2-keto-3-deoxy-6-phosphogluconate aldolase [Paenibacillus radicibacter]MCR8644808.1 bifunctional 2-keto-4-hydroxyglutarate aldolase/2-keto-3-deoxy-6-phosphogluconate aldolase [Paenibacillus radicibacter]